MKTPDFKQNKTFIDLVRDKVHPLPETGWNNVGENSPDTQHGVNFQNGSNFDSTAVPASWYLSENGEGRLRGHVKNVAAGDVIFTLPEEVRPEFTETYIVAAEDDGSIHLENIHFRAYQEGNATTDGTGGASGGGSGGGGSSGGGSGGSLPPETPPGSIGDTPDPGDGETTSGGGSGGPGGNGTGGISNPTVANETFMQLSAQDFASFFTLVTNDDYENYQSIGFQAGALLRGGASFYPNIGANDAHGVDGGAVEYVGATYGDKYLINTNDGNWRHIKVVANHTGTGNLGGLFGNYDVWHCEVYENHGLALTKDLWISSDIVNVDMAAANCFGIFGTKQFIDNLSIVTDSESFSHDFNDGTLGPFSQTSPNVWYATVIGTHHCVYGDTANLGYLYVDFTSPAISVTIEFDYATTP